MIAEVYVEIVIFFFSVTCLASKSVCAYIASDELDAKYEGDGILFLEYIASNKTGKERIPRLSYHIHSI